MVKECIKCCLFLQSSSCWQQNMFIFFHSGMSKVCYQLERVTQNDKEEHFVHFVLKLSVFIHLAFAKKTFMLLVMTCHVVFFPLYFLEVSYILDT